MPGKVHKDRQIQIAHHSAGCDRSAREVQDVDQAKWRDAIPLRGQYCKGARWEMERGLSGAPRCSSLFDERYAFGTQRSTNLLDIALADASQGFGVTARSTAEARRVEPTGITTFRQADVGEYLREEDTLFTT